MALVEGLEGPGKPLLHTATSSVMADKARERLASNHLSVSPGEHDASHDRMNLDERWSLDPGFDWGWSRRPVFHAGNSGLGGRICEILASGSKAS